MSNTCVTCGQEVAESDTPLKLAIQNSCNDHSWYDGWDAVWASWTVGDYKSVRGFDVVKVQETDPDLLDGYDTVGLEMVFEVGEDYWKVTGSWSSYDGKTWNEGLTKVEKKERTSVYYG